MSGTTGDFDMELPNLGDDRPGLEELDDDLDIDEVDDQGDDDYDDYPEDVYKRQVSPRSARSAG